MVKKSIYRVFGYMHLSWHGFLGKNYFQNNWDIMKWEVVWAVALKNFLSCKSSVGRISNFLFIFSKMHLKRCENLMRKSKLFFEFQLWKMIAKLFKYQTFRNKLKGICQHHNFLDYIMKIWWVKLMRNAFNVNFMLQLLCMLLRGKVSLSENISQQFKKEFVEHKCTQGSNSSRLFH